MRGIADYRITILWGTIWTTIGAGLSGWVATAMVKTFRQGLLAPDTPSSPILAAGVLAGAVLWELVASRNGLPVSTAHALTGAIVGVGLLTFEAEGLMTREFPTWEGGGVSGEPSVGRTV